MQEELVSQSTTLGQMEAILEEQMVIVVDSYQCLECLMMLLATVIKEVEKEKEPLQFTSNHGMLMLKLS